MHLREGRCKPEGKTRDLSLGQERLLSLGQERLLSLGQESFGTLRNLESS